MLRSLCTEESIQRLEDDSAPRRAKTRDEILNLLVKGVERIEVVRGDDVGPVPNTLGSRTSVVIFERPGLPKESDSSFDEVYLQRVILDR
jgi:hypothetical protein